MRTKIVGMGNPIITDDAVGVRLVQGLRGLLGERADVAWIEECSVGGLNLLDVVGDCDRLIVVDALQPGGVDPGTWRRFTAADLHPTLNLSSIHDTNFATALALGRRLGLPLPRDEEIHIFGVGILDDATFGERMTPELERRFPALLDEIGAQVRQLLA